MVRNDNNEWSTEIEEERIRHCLFEGKLAFFTEIIKKERKTSQDFLTGIQTLSSDCESNVSMLEPAPGKLLAVQVILSSLQ